MEFSLQFTLCCDVVLRGGYFVFGSLFWVMFVACGLPLLVLVFVLVEVLVERLMQSVPFVFSGRPSLNKTRHLYSSCERRLFTTLGLPA